MTIKKCGLILVIMASMLVAISSGFTGDWSSVPVAPSNTSPFGFGEYKTVTFGDGWINSDYKPVNLSEYFFGPTQIVPQETDTFKWKPVPLIMPQPLNTSKAQEIQSVISSLSSERRGSIFF
jgi:hypothetical protein